MATWRWTSAWEKEPLASQPSEAKNLTSMSSGGKGDDEDDDWMNMQKDERCCYEKQDGLMENGLSEDELRENRCK